MKIIITGASGMLGTHIIKNLASSSHELYGFSDKTSISFKKVEITPLDLKSEEQIEKEIYHIAPDLIIHTAAISSIKEAYENPEAAFSINRDSTRHLAFYGKKYNPNCRTIYISTDLVFSGNEAPYSEDDTPTPLSVYGKSKYAGEKACLSISPLNAVVRVSLMFGLSLINRATFFDTQINSIQKKKPIKLFTDEWRTPISYNNAAKAITKIAMNNKNGIIHLGGTQRVNRYQFGVMIANALGLSHSSIIGVLQEKVPFPEDRPKDVSLDSEKVNEYFPDVINDNLSDEINNQLKNMKNF